MDLFLPSLLFSFVLSSFLLFGLHSFIVFVFVVLCVVKLISFFDFYLSVFRLFVDVTNGTCVGLDM